MQALGMIHTSQKLLAGIFLSNITWWWTILNKLQITKSIHFIQSLGGEGGVPEQFTWSIHDMSSSHWRVGGTWPCFNIHASSCTLL